MTIEHEGMYIQSVRKAHTRYSSRLRSILTVFDIIYIRIDSTTVQGQPNDGCSPRDSKEALDERVRAYG